MAEILGGAETADDGAPEAPPAPAWFQKALAQEPEREMVPTPRGRIEALSWGERGRPGYGLHDRALGAMYLYGLWEGLSGS